MRLKKIELRNFKRLVDYQAQFRPGVNVVKGPQNEMGKSTLLEGIIVALFHNPKSTSKELRGYASWGSTRQFQTSLEFEEKGNRYLLEKDFDKGTIRLTDDNTRGELDTFKEVSEKMAELLGTKSDTLFSCSSCIRQAQVSEISSGRKEINESLEEIVSGGKESTLASQVIQKLGDKVSEMRKGLDRPAKSPGILARLQNELQDISRRCDEVGDEVSKVEAQKIELVDVNKRLTQNKEEYEKSKALLDKNKQRRDIEASINDLNRKYDEVKERLDGIDQLMAKLEGANEVLRSVEGFEDEQQVSEFRDSLKATQNKREDIKSDLATQERKLAEAKNKFDKRKAARFFGSGKSIAVGIIILAGGVIGAFVVSLYFLSLAILGTALLVISRWAGATLARENTSISGIERRIQDMKEAVGQLGEEEKELLAKTKCNTVDEFQKKERDFKSSLEKKRNLEAQLKGMLRGKTIEYFRDQRKEIVRGLAVEEAKFTDDLKATTLSPEKYIELERRVQSLAAEQNGLEKKKMECEIAIKQARFNIEDQIKLEEKREELREELKHEEKKAKVYGLAGEFISKASTEILSSAAEALEKEIQRYLSVFTNDKYKQVKVNKEALEFWVYSDEKENWAKPEELSGGVIDEFYLAFRLALARLIFGDKKPPLILDDPFVNFDSVRLAKTLDFFKTLASDYQIIIFTLGDSYDKVADTIILLGEEREHPATQQQIKGGD